MPAACHAADEAWQLGGDEAGDRGGVDDRPGALVQHVRQRLPAPEEDDVELGANRPLPLRQRHLVQRHEQCQGGVVVEYVDAPVAGDGGLDPGGDIGLVERVAGHELDSAAGVGRSARSLLGVEVAAHHARAFRGEA